ncbi:hypothetical protein GCM10009734_98370 [Nonomuraea bangladeshensis]
MANLGPAARATVRAAMDEPAAAIGTRDGDAGVAAIGRIQARGGRGRQRRPPPPADRRAQAHGEERLTYRFQASQIHEERASPGGAKT